MGRRAPAALCSACRKSSSESRTDASYHRLRPNGPDFSQIALACENLSQIELIWLLGWNIADGRWRRIGLDEAAGRSLLLDLFSKLHGGLGVLKESGGYSSV
jgi:hypothetical protein